MYLNATYQRNHDPPVSYKGHHTVDVVDTPSTRGMVNKVRYLVKVVDLNEIGQS